MFLPGTDPGISPPPCSGHSALPPAFPRSTSRSPRSGAAGPVCSSRGEPGRAGAATPSLQPNMEAPEEAAPGRGHSPAASRPTPAPRRCPGHTGEDG